jgi:hypothetical protein
MIDEIVDAVQAQEYELETYDSGFSEESFMDTMLRFHDHWTLSEKQLNVLTKLHQRACPHSKILHKWSEE